MKRLIIIVSCIFLSQISSGQVMMFFTGYAAWLNANLAGVYDGVYQYTVRGTAVNYPVVIIGAELRRKSNNNLLATLSARSNNWIRATVNGTNEVVNLYQFGNTWVGKNAAGQFVTLKKL